MKKKIITIKNLFDNGRNINVEVENYELKNVGPNPISYHIVIEGRVQVPAYHPFEKALIEKVIFNDPATIVIWADGTKTVVKCQPGDTYDKEKGLALCFTKRFLENKSRNLNAFLSIAKETDNG